LNNYFLVSITVTDPKDGDVVNVQGEFEIGSQYHFHMETQSCIVKPTENGQVKLFQYFFKE